MVIRRTFDGPARLVFEAWTRPELLKQWWVPKSMGMSLLSLDADVRTGGRYRLVFSHDASTMEFFGKYIEVTPPSRIVWTNEEGGDNGSVTTEKVGRVRTCTLGVRRLEEAAAWIERYHHLWSARFEALDTVIEALKRKEKVDAGKKRN